MELGFNGFMPLRKTQTACPWPTKGNWPLFEVVNQHEAVIYIHPTFPLGVEAMTEYMLMPMVGFLFDTTLAATHLVLAGVPERFPKIKWALGHLGGTIPYLCGKTGSLFPRLRGLAQTHFQATVGVPEALLLRHSEF